MSLEWMNSSLVVSGTWIVMDFHWWETGYHNLERDALPALIFQ
jgi:hypothetical protein